MSNSNKHAAKLITALCTAVFFSFAATGSANTLPTAEDINSSAEKVRLTVDTFMQKSFEPRMRYEYSGKFLNPSDKDNLHKLAERARNDLAETARKQEQLKQQIEDYEGDDWDAKYGASGLWRKLFADLYKTTLSKCEIDFYLALTEEQPQRNETLHRILAEIDSLNQTYKQYGPKLIKGKVLALLAQTDPVYKSAAIKELEAFAIYSDISRPIRAAIEKIKLAGSAKPNELNSFVRALAQNRYGGYIELTLSLMFVQRKYDPAGFEKSVRIFPETEDFLGSLVLSDISSRTAQQEDLSQISVFEAELAAQTAWKNGAKDYKTLLDYLSNTEKFQTPLILYVAAVAFAESSPTKATNLLVEASKLQKMQKSAKLDVEAEETAKQAAQLAYNLFVEDSSNCQLGLKAFENYIATANKKVDEELEYLYSIVLNDCGQATKSKELLEKIANRPTGNWRNRAKLDLIVRELQQTQDENQSRQNELLEQLSDFILSYHGQDKNSNRLRMEAITIYCQSLLESGDKSSAQKVLAILDKAEPTRGIPFDLFKSKALQQTGRLEESVRHMVLATGMDSGALAGVVMELLSEVVDTIDQLQTQTDEFDNMMQDCKKLAEFCYKSFSSDRRSGLLLAEISVFAAGKEKEKLLEIDKLLNDIAKYRNTDDVDLVRCRARLLSEQGKFSEAADLWAQICKIRKSEVPSANKRSWKWWRAKFYELDCWAKCPQTKKVDIYHTIEVLENSFTDIPPVWAEKLDSLKQQCLR